MDLIALNNNLKNLDVVDLAISVLDDMSNFIADLNREQLAVRGENDEGEALSPEYAEVTRLIKSKKSGTSGIIGHVTLFDTGDFHRSIISEVVGNELILGSHDDKLQMLSNKYGDFLGLTKESQEKVRVEFLNRFEPKLYAAIL